MVTADEFTYDETSTWVDDNFKKAAASYNNLVDNLNERARKYIDEKGIATDARSLGSIATLKDGRFQGDTTTEMYTGTGEDLEYLTTYKWNGKFKNEDTNYEDDLGQLKDLDITISGTYVWIASRRLNSNISKGTTTVYARNIGGSNNGLGTSPICIVDNLGRATYGSSCPSYKLIPVFLLPSDVVISRGDGSKENPYVIE